MLFNVDGLPLTYEKLKKLRRRYHKGLIRHRQGSCADAQRSQIYAGEEIDEVSLQYPEEKTKNEKERGKAETKERRAQGSRSSNCARIELKLRFCFCGIASRSTKPEIC